MSNCPCGKVEKASVYVLDGLQNQRSNKARCVRRRNPRCWYGGLFSCEETSRLLLGTQSGKRVI